MCILWICICLVIYNTCIYTKIYYIYSALLGKISEFCPFLPFSKIRKALAKGAENFKIDAIDEVMLHMTTAKYAPGPQLRVSQGSAGAATKALEAVKHHRFPKAYFFSEVNLKEVDLQPAADAGQCCFNFFFPIRPMKFPQI